MHSKFSALKWHTNEHTWVWVVSLYVYKVYQLLFLNLFLSVIYICYYIFISLYYFFLISLSI